MTNQNIQMIRDLINQAEALAVDAVREQTEHLSPKKNRLILINAMLKELKSVANSKVLDEEDLEHSVLN